MSRLPPITRSQTDVQALQAYLEIVWVAVQGAPGHPDLRGVQRRLQEGPFAVAVQVYDSRGDHSYLTLHLLRRGFEVHPGDPSDTRPRWIVSRRHLEEVLRDPERFVSAPSRLDLNWAR